MVKLADLENRKLKNISSRYLKLVIYGIKDILRNPSNLGKNKVQLVNDYINTNETCNRFKHQSRVGENLPETENNENILLRVSIANKQDPVTNAKIEFHNLLIEENFSESSGFEGIKILKFHNCFFKGSFEIRRTNLEHLEFKYCNFEEDFILSDINKMKNLDISDCVFHKFKVFRPGEQMETVIQNSEFKEGLFEDFPQEQRQRGTPPKRRSQKINLRGRLQSSHLVFRNLFLEELNIYEFSNQSDLTFESIYFEADKAVVEIKNSNLGNCHFINLDFNKLSKLEITGTNVSDILCSAVQWKYDIESGNDRLKRDVHRQLKYAMEKQGDRVEALKFQAKEL